MIRQIIQIDEDKCTGCGICAEACHESAIGIVDGKAKLLRDDYCDGMGDCLPTCPTGAITFVEREALAYDEEAVMANIKSKEQAANTHTKECGCPGAAMQELHPETCECYHDVHEPASQLQNWPVQIKLAPITAPYYDNANLLVAADCTAYTYAAFHQKFIRGKVTLIGCPKLDAVDYTEKLQAIIEQNNIKSLTIVRMVVPCCGGLEMAAKTALQQSGKFIPWQVTTIGIDGNILE